MTKGGPCIYTQDDGASFRNRSWNSNQIIDYKHRKKHEPGNVWGYYSKLRKEGIWEGKFMMWSGYIGIAYIVVATGYLFYALSRSSAIGRFRPVGATAGFSTWQPAMLV